MDIPPPSTLSTEEPTPAKPEEKHITFRRSTFFAALLPISFILGLAVGYVFWGLRVDLAALAKKNEPTPAAQAGDISPTEEAQKVTRYDVPADDDPSIGPASAPITIIEFSDFQCPYCRKWHAEVWPKLQEEYKDQVRLVYRDFPLNSIHAEAAPAAEAADCAGEQQQYWPFHDKLFNGGEELGMTGYEKYATALKLDLTKFKECMTSRRFQKEVEADFEFAANLGIQSTPTFFLNGIPLVGAQPYQVFKQVIDKELKGEIPR